ncbi:hypothetical protein M404DRAFT_1006279 [Pisolithus tinctorius Marx 270]|uniref:Uncharacterized protein n=1 Tax=Pisolithus tinctorius Marx 270 TaxID=870435 RepID=A0A0C3JHQ9_PISTI|nr:hypothetical protein M404DRAFT_1006279 [Pisolithus tinctorius Marx 270]
MDLGTSLSTFAFRADVRVRRVVTDWLCPSSMSLYQHGSSNHSHHNPLHVSILQSPAVYALRAIG